METELEVIHSQKGYVSLSKRPLVASEPDNVLFISLRLSDSKLKVGDRVKVKVTI